MFLLLHNVKGGLMIEDKMKTSNPVAILQAFMQNLAVHPLELDSNDEVSVLDLIYSAYEEIHREDSEEVRQGFCELDKHLQGVNLDDNDMLFSLVCQICCACEKKAFIDGARIGAHLMQEFQCS